MSAVLELSLFFGVPPALRRDSCVRVVSERILKRKALCVVQDLGAIETRLDGIRLLRNDEAARIVAIERNRKGEADNEGEQSKHGSNDEAFHVEPSLLPALVGAPGRDLAMEPLAELGAQEAEGD